MARWGKCDFRELERLQKRLNDLEKQKEEFCEACARELAARLLSLVIPRTPVGKAPKLENSETVDAVGENGGKRTFLSAQAAAWYGYEGGTLRRGWTAGKENINQNGNVVGIRGKQGHVSGMDVEKVSGNYVITVRNDVFYASYVEYGHRQKPGRYVPALGKSLKEGWVEGKFMLTISEKELQRAAPKIIEKKLNRFLKECLDAE